MKCRPVYQCVVCLQSGNYGVIKKVLYLRHVMKVYTVEESVYRNSEQNVAIWDPNICYMHMGTNIFEYA